MTNVSILSLCCTLFDILNRKQCIQYSYQFNINANKGQIPLRYPARELVRSRFEADRRQVRSWFEAWSQTGSNQLCWQGLSTRMLVPWLQNNLNSWGQRAPQSMDSKLEARTLKPRPQYPLRRGQWLWSWSQCQNISLGANQSGFEALTSLQSSWNICIKTTHFQH